jgi:hypothetical protein
MCISAWVTCLGARCLNECHALSTVTFATGSILTAISLKAFAECKSLSATALPSSVSVLDRDCFFGCEAPSALARIYMYCAAFHECRRLASLAQPWSVEHIGILTFASCSSLPRLAFASASRLAELLSLPPELVGRVDIPDSFEVCYIVTTENAPVLHLGCHSRLCI